MFTRAAAALATLAAATTLTACGTTDNTTPQETNTQTAAAATSRNTIQYLNPDAPYQHWDNYPAGSVGARFLDQYADATKHTPNDDLAFVANNLTVCRNHLNTEPKNYTAAEQQLQQLEHLDPHQAEVSVSLADLIICGKL